MTNKIRAFRRKAAAKYLATKRRAIQKKYGKKIPALKNKGMQLNEEIKHEQRIVDANIERFRGGLPYPISSSPFGIRGKQKKAKALEKELRAYPSSPVDLHVIIPHARCSMAR